ncbi:KpsF/GutQ family sugar-phosphate isomerase [Helicobacter sp. MIT 00-7814]|uniref:KpsF/GutQ family sugar-phosphate isomerase n=1 Tax=unclassified Helicobacter TaxID=2593540 RepID=UPI000E1E70B4|nr:MULTISPECIES: KpsF/GutQ family sugar-phosphate isomerase [unclassified Helicobacter]RDU54807.1 KpsF/GutQ family sugar-phosphate isomerase [Helicobacter sp. MIT 99-10781]RDU54865.1 KpsF/GutQ family sugar-phosphate isomerase [Helicobacter sp. MIT 00-7814]
MDFLKIAKEVLEIESSALLDSMKRLDSSELEKIVKLIANAKGKLIVVGVGKSGHIGAKISATLSSTGTPSAFLHPTEAMHGDLGMIQKDDVILAISYSGESQELLDVIPHIKRFGNPIITMSKDKNSSLSKMGDFFLNIFVEKEACPLNTAPTSSTTLTLALGDVLAVCLMHYRDFKHNDFASFHPGGSLGKRLFVKIRDLMQTQNLPIIEWDTPLKESIVVMTQARLGNALITKNGKLVAVLSDGDLRRALLKEDFNLEENVLKYATKSPKTCKNADMLAFDALKFIEENKIQILVITDEQDKIQGVIHLHTLISAGIKS